MPPIVFDIVSLLAAILRFLGLAVFGLGLGYLALDLLKKTELWQVQIAVFLGLIGLVIGMSVFAGIAGVAALAAGLGIAIFLWGMPKKAKKEDK